MKNVPANLGNLDISEDCLVLNIWSPKQYVGSIKELPVMFCIYGDGLAFGSIFTLPMHNRSVLASHDVVFSAANYS